nr:zinc finger protein 572-like [Penaeus vannamei]
MHYFIDIKLGVPPQVVSEKGLKRRSWGGDPRGRKNLNARKLHKCSYCNYITNKTTNLTRHIHTHTGEKPFSCPYCSFRATQEDNIKSHIRTHTGEKPYTCLHCPYRSSRKSNLNSHLLTHHPELQSHHIDIQTHHPDDQALHSDDQSHHSDVVELDSDGERTRWGGDAVRTKKNTGKMHRCSYCNYVTNKTTNLIRHIHTHTGEKPFSCPYCPYRATQENNIKSHIRTHTGEKPYKCPHCPYCSSQKSSLRNHILTHQNNTNCTQTCMNFRMKTVQIFFRLFYFEIQGSGGRGLLEIYSSLPHTPDSTASVYASSCKPHCVLNRPALTSSCIQATMRHQIDNSAPLAPECYINSAPLTTRPTPLSVNTAYTRQIAKTTTSQSADSHHASIYCRIKNATAYDRNNTTEVLPGCGPHIAGERGPCVGIQDGNIRLPQNSYGSHTKGTQPFLGQVHPGDKPFDCPHCSYSSATRDYLKIHIRTHTGEKPFQCPHCTFRAAQKNNLNRHLRIHTGEKPYACNICPYRSSQKNNLKSHLLTHRSQSDVENIM